MASQSQVFVKLTHKDPASLVDAATTSFTTDFQTFARSNNRMDLDVGVLELKNSPHDRAYAGAAAAAWKAANLSTGRIGAGKCKWPAMSIEEQAPFTEAVTRYEAAFRQSLVESGLFVAPAAKSQADKDKAKQDKAEKAEKAKADLLTAMVQAGEIVRVADVKTIKDMSVSALVGELLNRPPADLRHQEADIRSLLVMATKGNDDYASACAQAEAAETAAIAAQAKKTRKAAKAA